MPNHTIRQGHDLKRFREMLNLWQEAHGREQSEGWKQQKVFPMAIRDSRVIR